MADICGSERQFRIETIRARRAIGDEGERTVLADARMWIEWQRDFPRRPEHQSLSGVTSTTVVRNLNADMVDGKHRALAQSSSSAAPTFDANKASTFKITLAGQVRSSTFSGAAPGQFLNFIICQDEAGDHSFRWPSNVRGGMVVGTTASRCSVQSFVFDGTYAYALSNGVVDE